MVNKSIVFLINSFWIYSSKGASGGDEFVFQYIENTKFKFNKIYIICNSSAQKIAQKRLKNKKIEWIITPVYFDFFPFYISYFFRTAYVMIYFLLCGSKFTYIYSSSDFFPDVFPSSFNSFLNPKSTWIQVIHHLYPKWTSRPGNIIYSFFGFYLQKLSLNLIQKCNKIICVNNDLHSLFLKKFKKQKIIVVNGGIDLERISKIKKKINYKKLKKKYTAVYLGRLKPSKGIFDLPKIWKIVNKHQPGSKLILIGEGSSKDKNKLKKLISKEKLEKLIIVKGFLSDQEIVKIFYQSEVFIFPSREEGFGMAILEALCCDLQVIVWNLKVFTSVYKDLVLKSKCFDLKDFSQKIVRSLKFKKKINRIKEINNIKIKYSLSTQVNKIDNFILNKF